MAKALPAPEGAKGKKAKGTGLVSMKELEALYASEAQAAAVAAPQSEGAPRVVLKDGVFYLGEQMLPSPLNAIVVAEAHLNVWYPEAYDPDNRAPPGCFALAPSLEKDADGNDVPGTGDAGMRAHPTSPKMQGGPNGHDCATCELNKFGSAETGRGKACANTRQLAIVMADDPGFSSNAPLTWATLSISPTGLPNWGKFVKSLASIERRPPHGAVIQFDANKMDKVEQRRKAVVAVGYRLISDPAVALKVNALRKEIMGTKALLRPLPVDVQEPKKPAAAKGKPAKGKKAPPPARAARF